MVRRYLTVCVCVDWHCVFSVSFGYCKGVFVCLFYSECVQFTWLGHVSWDPVVQELIKSSVQILWQCHGKMEHAPWQTAAACHCRDLWNTVQFSGCWRCKGSKWQFYLRLPPWVGLVVAWHWCLALYSWIHSRLERKLLIAKQLLLPLTIHVERMLSSLKSCSGVGRRWKGWEGAGFV